MFWFGWPGSTRSVMPVAPNTWAAKLDLEPGFRRPRDQQLWSTSRDHAAQQCDGLRDAFERRQFEILVFDR